MLLHQLMTRVIKLTVAVIEEYLLTSPTYIFNILLKVNSINRRNYWQSSLWSFTSFVNYLSDILHSSHIGQIHGSAVRQNMANL
jgi:hypothetical protein